MTLPANSVGTAQLKNNAGDLAQGQERLVAPWRTSRQVRFPQGLPGPRVLQDQRVRPARPVPFPDALPSGKTIRGAFNIGGTAAAAGALANTSISFIYAFAAPPTVKIVLQGAAAPAECTGNATFPQAQAGFLCIYEESKTNSVGVTLNAVNRSGATIFTNSSAAGGFFSYGTWAATGT